MELASVLGQRVSTPVIDRGVLSQSSVWQALPIRVF